MFSRYFAASLLALVLDLAILTLLATILGWDATLSAALAYLIAALFHYAISRRHIFTQGWLRARPSLELGAFLVSGACGASVTAAIVGLLTNWFGTSLALAKTVAVGVSFFLVYLLRLRLVFRPGG